MFDSLKEFKKIIGSIEKIIVIVVVVVVEDRVLDGGYGWVCIFCSFMIYVNIWGVGLLWGIFFDCYIF